MGMGMNLKLSSSSFPQFCGVAACNTLLPRNTNSRSRRDSSVVPHAFRPSNPINKLQQRILINGSHDNPKVRSKDYRAGEIPGHCKAQPSVVDMFLQGNTSYNNSTQDNNSTQEGWNGIDTETEGSEFAESTRMDENSGHVSRIKYKYNKNCTDLSASCELSDSCERNSGTQFLQGGENPNKMGLGEDGFQQSSSYEKVSTHDKQSSEGNFLDLAGQSNVGDIDMIVQESVADNVGFIGRKLSESGSGSASELPKKSPIMNSDKELDSMKQTVKRSSIIAKQVISKTSALSLGFVSQLWVDTSAWIVQMVEIRPSLFSGEMDRFFLKDLCQVGDVILVEDENVLENELTMIGLDTLVGYNIIMEDSYPLGKIRDYKFDINLGNVAYLEFDSFGVPFIPPSVVSTYCLLVEDVIKITSDTIVVHSGADVRVQRLTKGLWEAPNLHAQEWNDAKLRKSNLNSQDYEGQISTEDKLERPLNLLSKKYYSNKGRGKKSASKESNIKDEWGLPLDY